LHQVKEPLTLCQWKGMWLDTQKGSAITSVHLLQWSTVSCSFIIAVTPCIWSIY